MSVPSQVWWSMAAAAASLIPSVLSATMGALDYSTDMDRLTWAVFHMAQYDFEMLMGQITLAIYAIVYAGTLLLRSTMPRMLFAVLVTIGAVIVVLSGTILEPVVLAVSAAQVAAVSLLFTRPVTAWLAAETA
jgi:hypothetical protein